MAPSMLELEVVFAVETKEWDDFEQVVSSEIDIEILFESNIALVG